MEPGAFPGRRGTAVTSPLSTRWVQMNALSGMVTRNLGIHPDSIEDDTLVGTAVLLIASPVFAFWMANGRFRLAMLVSTLCSCASAWVLLLGALHLSGRMIFVSLAVNGLSGPMAVRLCGCRRRPADIDG